MKLLLLGCPGMPMTGAPLKGFYSISCFLMKLIECINHLIHTALLQRACNDPVQGGNSSLQGRQPAGGGLQRRKYQDNVTDHCR